MSAATQSIDTPVRAGNQVNVPLAANAVIFLGTLVALNSTGFLVPAADTAGLRVIGRAEQDMDNTGGADGAVSADVTRGVFGFANSGTNALTAASVGKQAFVQDNQTVANTNVHGVRAGLIVDFDSQYVWVDTTRASTVPTALAQTGVAVATTAAVDLATAEALANANKAAVNECIVDIAAIIAILKSNGLAV